MEKAFRALKLMKGLTISLTELELLLQRDIDKSLYETINDCSAYVKDCGSKLKMKSALTLHFF